MDRNSGMGFALYGTSVQSANFPIRTTGDALREMEYSENASADGYSMETKPDIGIPDSGQKPDSYGPADDRGAESRLSAGTDYVCSSAS